MLVAGHTLREDQVDQRRELGISPALFPMHIFCWGDFHRDSVLGPERAANISPTGWLMPHSWPHPSVERTPRQKATVSAPPGSRGSGRTAVCTITSRLAGCTNIA